VILLNSRKKTWILVFLALLSIFAGTTQTAVVSAQTLEAVKANNLLRCGVSPGIPGFSSLDEQGEWQGLDVDICRGVAAAVLGNASLVDFIPQVELQGFTSLQNGDIDLLVSNNGWSLSRDTALGLVFVTPSYFGDQGFMGHGDLAGKKTVDMKEPTVCLRDENVLRQNLDRYFGKDGDEGRSYHTIVFRTPDQAVKAFDMGRCDLLYDMKAYLWGLRKYLVSDKDVVLLDEVVGREVHGPVIRQNDFVWFSVVRWVLYTMLKAEEYDYTSVNVDQYVVAQKADFEKLLGGRGGSGAGLGLKKDWMYQIIKQVGNYQEVFEKNIGKKSDIRMARGLNALSGDGGLLFAPSFQ